MPNERDGNIVFVVGAPRSGTTWVQRLLASHPRVKTGQESKLFRSYISPQMAAWRWEAEREQDASTATGRGGTGLSCYLTEDQFVSLLGDYTRRVLEAMTGNLAPGDWFVEKTPTHALCLPEIRLFVPSARIIHVLRDGRDVVASLLAAGRTWGAGWAPRAASEAATSWVRCVQAVRENAAGFAPSRFLEVRYEELSSDPSATLRRLFAFLDLEARDEEIAATVRANSPEAVRTGGGTAIHLGGRLANLGVVKDPPEFVRRAAAGGWRQDLTALQKWTTWRIAGPLLRELGYDWPLFEWRQRVIRPFASLRASPRERA